ncbi:SulP family inorganic anion transporter, partial [Streptomyces bambusae]
MTPRTTRFTADLSASIAVFLIALPLSLGIALATGAPLQAGLVAAAAGGIVAGRLGGAPPQGSGAAARLPRLTPGVVPHYGWRPTRALPGVGGLFPPRPPPLRHAPAPPVGGPPRGPSL